MFTMVEPIRKLIKVQRQIFIGNLVENAGNSPLKQRPNVFNPVSMDFPGLHIGFLMVDGIMDELRAIKPLIGGKFIGMDFGPRFGVGADEARQSAFFDIVQSLHTDFA